MTGFAIFSSSETRSKHQRRDDDGNDYGFGRDVVAPQDVELERVPDQFQETSLLG